MARSRRNDGLLASCIVEWAPAPTLEAQAGALRVAEMINLVCARLRG